jgi:DNA-binding NtrC family response regulator
VGRALRSPQRLNLRRGRPSVCRSPKRVGIEQTRRRLLAARGLSISADSVRQTLAARNAETPPTGHSFTTFAGDLLACAQKGELHDAHARMLAEAEREILTQAITLAEGNQAKAARWLGLSRLTLREKLKQLGLHPDSTEANSETNV